MLSNIIQFSLISAVVFISTNTAAMETRSPIKKNDFSFCVDQFSRHSLSNKQRQKLVDAILPCTEGNTDGDLSDSTVAEPRKKRSRVCSVKISPIKPKSEGGIGQQIRRGAIYGLIAMREGEDIAPPHADRINFADLENLPLNEALLEIEMRLRKWVQKDELIYYRTIYVGLAIKMTSRFNSGHGPQLKEVSLLSSDGSKLYSYFTNRKKRFFGHVFERDLNASMHSFVYNVPEELLPVIEVIVGKQFNVLSKANSLLGNEDAWKTVAAYVTWEQRAKVLEREGLLDTVEKLDEDCFDSVLFGKRAVVISSLKEFFHRLKLLIKPDDKTPSTTTIDKLDSYLDLFIGNH